ncbi:MAG: VPGUxxT family thioredoxin-like (seleno)protein, type 2, partial [Myxococcota bacterium]
AMASSVVGCSTPAEEVRVGGADGMGQGGVEAAQVTPPVTRATAAKGSDTQGPWWERPEQPVELGRVAWGRDLEGALAASRRSGKPVLVLFDEVPGCHTVVTYGKTVLSHPLVVEAAESLFEPVVVYNNVDGRDAQWLKSFGEPSWNNPVVRIIDADREPKAPRLSGDFSVGGLAEAMVVALGENVPPWLTLLAQETTAQRDGTSREVFSMGCFWSGEAGLGAIDGVVSTKPGFAGGREVVEVTYDPTVVERDALIRQAQGVGRAMKADAVRVSSRDDKYNLAHTSWRHVPMTALQASRANAWVAKRRDPSAFFSPRQRWLHAQSQKHPDAGWPVHLGQGELMAAFDAAAALVQQP